MQVDPAVRWEAQQILGNQVSVGHHRNNLRSNLRQPRAQSIAVLGAWLERGWRENLDSMFLGQRLHRAGVQGAPAAAACIRTGDDSGYLVV